MKVGRIYRLKVDCFGGATEKALERGLRLAAAKRQAEHTEMFEAGELVNLEAGTRVRVEALASPDKVKVTIVDRDQVVWIHERWAQ